MDGLAHVLWTNALFYSKYAHDRRQRYWAAFFGLLPDVIAFGPVITYTVVTGTLFHNSTLSDYMAPYANPTGIYAVTVQLYNYSHSLVVFAIAFICIWLARRGKPYWPMLGWAVHIVIDMFTHKDFFRTPFLYPLSNYHNPYGTDWGNPLFLAVNYGCLIVVYIIIWQWQKRHRQVNAQAN